VMMEEMVPIRAFMRVGGLNEPPVPQTERNYRPITQGRAHVFPTV
jgi:hypothetical protein